MSELQIFAVDKLPAFLYPKGMFTPYQLNIINAPGSIKIFLHGPAGCGKTTTGVQRVRFLLEAGAPGESILVLTPQRTLQEPYLNLLNSPERRAGGEVTLATIGGLARRMVELFWPLCAEAAGFARPDQPPIFLTLETAQYFMAHLVRPLLDQGYFESVTIDRNRLYAQILDNLNKAAGVGFDYRTIGERLSSAWNGDPAQRRVYADAQDCANRFRDYCLAHNLLDFSLQLEVFWEHLWPQPVVREFLRHTYRHLIYDNVEEDIPRAHDLVRDWLPEFQSALIIYDENGGYRQFLGADPYSAWQFADLSNWQARFDTTFVQSAAVIRLENELNQALGGLPALIETEEEEEEETQPAFDVIDAHFYPQLLDEIAARVEAHIQSGLPPEEIVVLAPYLSDALRFAIMTRLERRGIPARSHRPSRSLRDEPPAQALLTLAALAHPHWEVHPPHFDAAYALMLALDSDLIRAQLLTEICYRAKDLRLSPFEEIAPEMQERITYTLGERYTRLREWILDYRQSQPLPLDHFLRKLFGEVLSQPGFGFHANFDAVRVAASLVDSVKKFRQALETAAAGFEIGREYIAMLQEGVIAAQYLEGWRAESKAAVLVAPATTFLMMNRPASVQIWLDAGANGWVERLSQPLTQPYVLSRVWPPGRVWSDADEVEFAQIALRRLVCGLLRRCRTQIYLGFTALGENGFEQRGGLLRVFQKRLQA